MKTLNFSIRIILAIVMMPFLRIKKPSKYQVIILILLVIYVVLIYKFVSYDLGDPRLYENRPHVETIIYPK